jgi:hypothetical protein
MPWLSRSGGNASVMITVPLARIIAAPTACSARITIRNHTSGDSPASSEATVNSANPVR